MVSVAAFALMGLHLAPAEPWINQFMGVPRSAVNSLIKFDDVSDYLVSKDGSTLLTCEGDPTGLVWAMKSEDDSAEEFDYRDLLNHLGYEGGRATAKVWSHNDSKTPLLTSLPGLKEGWQAFIGEYDALFVGPELSGDFDQSGAGVKDEYPRRMSEFLADRTWKGSVAAFGKAQHIELVDVRRYELTWRAAGPVTEINLNIEIPKTDDGQASLKNLRAEKSIISELTFALGPGIEDWKAAFRTVGLNPEGATMRRSEEDEDLVAFDNVEGIPTGWTVWVEYHSEDISHVSVFRNEPEEEPRRR